MKVKVLLLAVSGLIASQGAFVVDLTAKPSKVAKEIVHAS